MEPLTVYGWWGNSNEPPSHLKTKKQLAEMGMKPVKPVGVIYAQKYDLYLYNPDHSQSAIAKRKPTEAQLKALEAGREKQRFKAEYREWYQDVGRLIRDRNRAIKWAKGVLDSGDQWGILDIETTGLSESEVVQIGIINLEGKTILDTLIRPIRPISEEAIAIHGITNEAVVNAPTFPEIYSKIVETLKDKKVAIYNANFDVSILKYCCQLHRLPLLVLSERSDCVMNWYAEYYGEWSNYYNSYKWQSLGGKHDAVGDCLATLALIKEMAQSRVVEDLEAEFRKVLSR